MEPDNYVLVDKEHLQNGEFETSQTIANNEDSINPIILSLKFMFSGKFAIRSRILCQCFVIASIFWQTFDFVFIAVNESYRNDHSQKALDVFKNGISFNISKEALTNQPELYNNLYTIYFDRPYNIYAQYRTSTDFYCDSSTKFHNERELNETWKVMPYLHGEQSDLLRCCGFDYYLFSLREHFFIDHCKIPPANESFYNCMHDVYKIHPVRGKFIFWSILTIIGLALSSLSIYGITKNFAGYQRWYIFWRYLMVPLEIYLAYYYGSGFFRGFSTYDNEIRIDQLTGDRKKNSFWDYG